MQLFGILAHPVKHSLSPIVHNAGFKAIGFKGDYKTWNVTPEKFEAFFEKKVGAEKIGLSVSMPYKEDVVKHCGVITDAARRIGAVNTLYFRGSQSIGHNTDFIGIQKPLLEKIDLEDARVVILGAGGAARAAAYACTMGGAKIVILNRSIEKARKIAKDFPCKVATLDKYDKKYFDVVINTTSVGMMTDESLLKVSDFSRNQVVFDVVYRPIKTQFIKNAEKAGATVITGDKMFLTQAYEQFKLFTLKEVPVEAMEKAFYEALESEDLDKDDLME